MRKRFCDVCGSTGDGKGWFWLSLKLGNSDTIYDDICPDCSISVTTFLDNRKKKLK